MLHWFIDLFSIIQILQDYKLIILNFVGWNTRRQYNQQNNKC